jgi:VWFA-related protein
MKIRVVQPALLAILSGVVLSAVQGQPPTPTFRVGATLIELTLVATDEEGQPVIDLKQEEIEIVERSKRRPIDFFNFDGSAFAPGSTRAEKPIEPIAPGIFSNRPEYFPGPPRNITAIVLDTLNTLPEDQVAVRAQVMQYLRALAPNTRVAIYAAGTSLKSLHDYSDNLESLRARLEKTRIDYNIQALAPDEAVRLQQLEAEHLNKTVEQSGEQSKEDQQAEEEYRKQLENVRSQMARLDEYFYEQLHRKRIDLTLASLEVLGNHLAGIAGRKNLVWISGGVPILTSGARDRWVVNYEPRIREIAQRLASQGIAVYPVQASALQVGLLGTSSVAQGTSRGQLSELRPMTRENDLRLWSTMDVLADVTGGRSFKNTNDLAAGVRAAASDARGSYSVGFYVPEEAENRWHEVSIRVKRPGVRLLHRKGYLTVAPARQPQSWSQEEWQTAMQNPLGSTAIRLDARADSVDSGLRIVLQVATDDLTFKRVDDQPVTDLEIGLGERNQKEWTRVRRDGATITIKEDPQRKIAPSIVRFAKIWTMNADTTLTRIVVRDRLSGRFGVLDMPMNQIQ